MYLHFPKGEDDERDLEKLEEKVWDPSSSLTEKQIDQFLVVARYVHALVHMVKLRTETRNSTTHMLHTQVSTQEQVGSEGLQLA